MAIVIKQELNRNDAVLIAHYYTDPDIQILADETGGYVPEARQGDKRIILIDGEPVPYALARIPTGDDNRGNIVAGATTRAQELSAADKRICDVVGPVLRDQGVLFAGIDVIGEFMTEVNVTSPTGIRELDRAFDLNIAGLMFDAIQKHL